MTSHPWKGSNEAASDVASDRGALEPPARLCPYCFAGTAPNDTTCWLCKSALPPFASRPLPDAAPSPAIAGERTRSSERTPHFEPDFILWATGTLIACLFLPIVLAQLAFEVGVGFAILGAIVCAPVVLALATMMWIRRPRLVSVSTNADDASATRGERRKPIPLASAASRVIGGVAFAVTIVLAVLVLIVLLLVTVVVLIAVACTAILFAASVSQP